jgi:hypothetical protein
MEPGAPARGSSVRGLTVMPLGRRHQHCRQAFAIRRPDSHRRPDRKPGAYSPKRPGLPGRWLRSPSGPKRETPRAPASGRSTMESYPRAAPAADHRRHHDERMFVSFRLRCWELRIHNRRARGTTSGRLADTQRISRKAWLEIDAEAGSPNRPLDSTAGRPSDRFASRAQKYALNPAAAR